MKQGGREKKGEGKGEREREREKLLGKNHSDSFRPECSGDLSKP